MCNPVRFDGKDFLEKLEGKKIMFIGDSVSLNHYESLLCLLHAAVPDARITTQTSNSTNTVTFEDHGVSISVFETHYLVDIEQEQIGRVLKLESIKDGNTWKDMDVLVFNTWLWWYRRGPKQPWDYVQEGQSVLKDMDRMVAFQKGLTTWAKWVDSDVDTSRTTVIFQGISPFHYHGEEWDEPGATSYPGGSPLAWIVLIGVLQEFQILGMNFSTQLLSWQNITAERIAGPDEFAFGHTMMADDPLTEGPELSSKLVGKAQGIYATARLLAK
ncbi:hypothetical protein NC652_009783 [Populus alba x Populus x berolinensis]|nr:hypothetical protein NC652_009783 [Populus alba x Populus x berolinensis]